MIDPALGTWETFFNTMGAVTGDADPLGNGSNVSYDERELPDGFGDASGRTTQVGYDAQGHATSVTDNAGQVATTTVNNVGVPTSHTNRLGDTWTDVRNALDELLQVQSPLGLTWQRTVDARGRTTSATGPAGRTWTIDRDARGLTRTVIAPDGSQVSVARNASGQATSITDEIGGVWTQTLDPAGRPQTFTDPLGNAVTQTYNNRNRVIQQTFPVGLGNVNVNHDANGQLSQLAYSDGTTRDYVYDANGWLVGASGVSLTRDAAGRVTESNGIVTTRGPAGRIIQTEFGPGVWAQYGYDTNGWLQTVTDWTDPATPAIVFNRDLEGKIVSITRANGTSTTRTYNADGRLASLQHFGPGPTLLAQVTITYGADGRPASKTREADVVNPGSPHGTQSIARNAAGQPTALDGSPITHNALGQRVSDAERTWSWRLDGTPAAITATAGGITTTIDTDALGATTAIVAGAIASTLTWNYATPMPTLAAIDQAPNVQLNVNDPETGIPLYAVDPIAGARTYPHFDEYGNGWLWTDDAGNLRLTQTYSPDGQDIAHVGDLTASGLIPVGFNMAFNWLDLRDLNGLYWPPFGPPVDPEAPKSVSENPIAQRILSQSPEGGRRISLEQPLFKRPLFVWAANNADKIGKGSSSGSISSPGGSKTYAGWDPISWWDRQQEKGVYSIEYHYAGQKYTHTAGKDGASAMDVVNKLKELNKKNAIITKLTIQGHGGDAKMGFGSKTRNPRRGTSVHMCDTSQFETSSRTSRIYVQTKNADTINVTDVFRSAIARSPNMLIQFDVCYSAETPTKVAGRFCQILGVKTRGCAGKLAYVPYTGFTLEGLSYLRSMVTRKAAVSKMTTFVPVPTPSGK